MPNLRLKNVLDTVVSLLSNAATVARNWVLPDKDGTIAFLDDLTNKADLVGGKVPASQLPAYVDDVLEFANLAAFPVTGEADKIYVAMDTNLTYRWSGSAYVNLDTSLALGETSSTAYRGDRGKTAFDHTSLTNNPHSVTAAQVGAYSTSEADTLLAAKVDKETFTTLTFATPTNWDTNNRQSPLAKVTATGSFTINMTNVKSGSSGVLKLITNTAGAITLTFDTDFTNKRLGTIGQETFTTYTFPAATGKEYLLFYVCEGTTLHWYIDDSGTIVDWSTGITPVGWASFTSKQCRYKDDGKMIFMDGEVSGTGSAGTAVTFSLPFAPSATLYTGTDNIISFMQAFNNVTASPGMITLTAGSLTGKAFTSTSGGAWTANTTRQIRFSFFYFK